MKNLFILFLVLSSLGIISCNDDDSQSTSPNLIIKFKFDENQVRLNNIGQPSTIPLGNAAQTPNFKKISAHYIEFSPNALTPLGNGNVLYFAEETSAGGTNAIDFSKSIIKAENETVLSIPIKDIAPGTFEWARVSLSFQEYGITVTQDNVDYSGTIQSFVGYNTYITSHNINNNVFNVNANRLQGYWAFALDNLPFATSGQAPEGATTVPNPLFNTSPIPAGSCVVTGSFAQPLTITGDETNDVVVTFSLSINQSFEWQDGNGNGKYEPSLGENVVDMGLRGLIPSYIK